MWEAEARNDVIFDLCAFEVQSGERDLNCDECCTFFSSVICIVNVLELASEYCGIPIANTCMSITPLKVRSAMLCTFDMNIHVVIS